MFSGFIWSKTEHFFGDILATLATLVTIEAQKSFKLVLLKSAIFSAAFFGTFFFCSASDVLCRKFCYTP